MSSSFTDKELDDDDTQKKKKIGKMSASMKPRPNAAPGWWLFFLLPFALGVHFIRHPTELPENYKDLIIAAFGMLIEVLFFFFYVRIQIPLHLKLIFSFLPGLFTGFLYIVYLDQPWSSSLVWGFGITFWFQNIYIRVLQGLPNCFSYGEAAILVQGLMLFMVNVGKKFSNWPIKRLQVKEDGDFEILSGIMMSALSCLLVSCFLICIFPLLRKPLGFYPLMVTLLLAVTCMPITKPLPIVALIEFILSDTNRLLIIGLYIVLVGVTILAISWQLRDSIKASTRMRKIFHLLIVTVYVPGILYECALLYIATGVALAIFTVLELFRILKIPPLAETLEKAFASFSDEKDAGILALTPFSLLIGCSLPLWISPCACNNAGKEEFSKDLLPLLSGILTVGIGDAAASIIGSKFGRIKWRNSSRSIEGTIAFIVSIFATVCGLQLYGFLPLSQSICFITIQATVITALVEAHTDQIDNMILPLVFYTIISIY